jgi:hypothetical protein
MSKISFNIGNLLTSVAGNIQMFAMMMKINIILKAFITIAPVELDIQVVAMYLYQRLFIVQYRPA